MPPNPFASPYDTAVRALDDKNKQSYNIIPLPNPYQSQCSFPLRPAFLIRTTLNLLRVCRPASKSWPQRCHTSLRSPSRLIRFVHGKRAGTSSIMTCISSNPPYSRDVSDDMLQTRHAYFTSRTYLAKKRYTHFDTRRLLGFLGSLLIRRLHILLT